MYRREFIKGTLMAASTAAIASKGWAGRSPKPSGVSLIPSRLSQAPNYWCTWSTQNYMFGDHSRHIDPKELEGRSGAVLAERELTEKNVFGPGGWAAHFFPDVRGDLFFLFDEGWESQGYATFLLDTQKFPSFAGAPEARLQKMNETVRKKGWRGAALWCRSTPGMARDIAPLVQRSKNAGIAYWKIDGGDRNFAVDRVRDELRAPLATEHVYGELPLNGDWHATGRFPTLHWDSPRVEILKKADVYRTYDTTPLLSIPTTLDRASQLLNAVQGHPEVHGLLNVEDEVYIAAVLGCTMGIMRFPLHGLRPDGDPDIAFAGPRKTKRRMDEVARAIHWQRIAPPYSVGAGFVRLDSQILTDDWIFRRGETWYTQVIGQLVKQGAPARISRNIELPKVESMGERPFVYAGRFPNGAVAIATQQRTRNEKGWFMPLADIMLDVGDASGPFGIFGHFRNLHLTFDHSLRGMRVLAQDLRGGHAVDITQSVKVHEKDLYISGGLISAVGLHEASSGDLSDPGMVMKLV